MDGKIWARRWPGGPRERLFCGWASISRSTPFVAGVETGDHQVGLLGGGYFGGSGLGRGHGHRGRLGRHGHTGADALEAVHDDRLAGLESLADDALAVDDGAELHRAVRDGVVLA